MAAVSDSAASPPTSSDADLQRRLSVAERAAAFLCKDVRPTETICGDGFIEFAQALIDLGAVYGHVAASEVLPSSVELTTGHLLRMRNELKDRHAQHVFKFADRLTYTADIWADSDQCQWVTVTGHYFTDDFQLQSVALGTEELLRDHKSDPVIATAPAFFDFEVWTPSEGRIVVVDPVADTLCCFGTCQRLNCTTAMLNSVVDDVMVIGPEDFPLLSELITTAKQLFDAPRLALSGWDSLYNILSVANGLILQDGLDTETPATFNNDNLSRILEIFGLFREARDSLSTTSGGHPTLNKCVLWKVKLEEYCYDEDENCNFGDVRGQLWSNLRAKFILHPLHYVALFLDPNFKSIKMLTEAERKLTLDTVTSLMRDAAAPPTDRPSTSEPPPLKMVPSVTKKYGRSWTEFDEFLGMSDCIEDEVETELRCYRNRLISAPVANILDFWKTSGAAYPMLQKIARVVLSVPASASIEEPPLDKKRAVLAILEPGCVNDILSVNKNLKFFAEVQ